MSKNGKDNLVHCIGKLAKVTQKVARVAEQQYSAEVEAILKSKSGDSGRIERCLDGRLHSFFSPLGFQAGSGGDCREKKRTLEMSTMIPARVCATTLDNKKTC